MSADLPPDQTPPPIPAPKPPREEGKKLGFPMMLVMGIVGAVNLFITIIAVKLGGNIDSSPASVGEYVGGVIGAWGVVPLVVCIIFSFFKPFRKNAPRLALVAIVVWMVTGVAQIGKIGAHAGTRMADKVTLDDMIRKTAELRRRLADTKDPEEANRLTRELAELNRKTSEKLVDPDSRAATQLITDVTGLWQKQNLAYIAAVTEFIKPGGLLPSALSGASETLEPTRAKLKELADANLKLKVSTETMWADLNRRISDKTLSLRKREVLKGFRDPFEKQLPYLQIVRETDIHLYRAMDEYLALLQENPLWWSRQSDGSIQWSDETKGAKAMALTSEIREQSLKQNEARQAALKVTPPTH